MTSKPFVSLTFATLRSAEFGFFGVVVYTRVQTPRRWGEPFSAGVLVFSTLSSRPLRTSWLIVGMGGLDLLPALGWCSLVLADVCACCPASCPGARCRPRSDRPILAATHRPGARRRSPATWRLQPLVTQAHREREQAQGTLGTADHDTRASETGQSRVPHTRSRWPAVVHRGGRHRGERHRDRFSSRVGRSPGGSRRQRGRYPGHARAGSTPRGPRERRTRDLASPCPHSLPPVPLEDRVDPDAARELKARIIERLPSAVEASSLPGEHDAPWPWVAVGLSPTDDGARVAVRLQRDGDRALLPDLGRAAEKEVEVRVIGPVRSLASPGELQGRVRPLRPRLSVGHESVTPGTLGGLVRTASGLAILSNNHVLAASNAASPGDVVLQPGPADGGGPGGRVATLTAFER